MLDYGPVVMFLRSRVKEHRGNTMSPAIHCAKRVMGLCVFTDHVNELHGVLFSRVQSGTTWGAFIK